MNRVFGMLLAFAFWSASSLSLAQEAQGPKRFGDIPKDSIGVFALDFDKMRSSKEFEMWPWEVMDVAAQEQLGIDLSKIESIDGMILMPSPEPEFGISIRTKQPYDIADLPDGMFAPLERSPKDESLRFRDFAQEPTLRLMQRDANRMLLGTQGALRRMTSSRLQAGGDFVGLVQNSSAMFKMAVNLESLRDLISAFALSEGNQIPEEILEDVERIIDLTDNALVEFYPDATNGIEFSLGTSGGDKTELLDKSLLRLRQQFVNLFVETLSTQMEQDPSVSLQMKQAIKSYIARMRKVIENESFWTIENDRLVMKVESSMMGSYQVIGVMTGLLLPAVQAAREAARRMSSSNNLRQIMLAFHNYESAYRKLPAQAIVDDDGKPLLSWRVAILPYLEQGELYNEFHLDEPWDSEHNIKLLERMPEIFRNPSNPPASGITTYLVPMGDGVGLGPDGLEFQQITDGTSNTLAVLDVDFEMGVPWTKPDDLDIESFDQGGAIGYLRVEGFNAAFFDGSVRFLSSSMDMDLLRALMTRAGGEQVPYLP